MAENGLFVKVGNFDAVIHGSQLSKSVSSFKVNKEVRFVIQLFFFSRFVRIIQKWEHLSTENLGLIFIQVYCVEFLKYFERKAYNMDIDKLSWCLDGKNSVP